jgi:hypothetical protein
MTFFFWQVFVIALVSFYAGMLLMGVIACAAKDTPAYATERCPGCDARRQQRSDRHAVDTLLASLEVPS